jgi:hypothetical protein
VTDISLTRALLELLGSYMMTASLFGILWFSGIDSGIMFVPDALPEVARIRDQLLRGWSMIPKSYRLFG